MGYSTQVAGDYNCTIVSPTDRLVEVWPVDLAAMEGEITVPSSVEIEGETYNVVSIARYGFQDNTKITGLTIPEGVVSLNFYCLRRMSNMKYVHFPSTLQYVAEGFCKDNVSLDSLVFRCTNLKKIYNITCQGCTSVKYIHLPDSIEFLGNSAFSGLTALERVENTGNLKHLDGAVFKDTPNLQGIELPAHMDSIGSMCFHTSGIQELIIPEGVRTVAQQLCVNATRLKHVKMPSHVNWFGPSAFQGCTSLETVEMPETVSNPKMSTGLFNGCANLTTINLPRNISIIPYAMFYGCAKLQLKDSDIPATVVEYGAQCFSGMPL